LSQGDEGVYLSIMQRADMVHGCLKGELPRMGKNQCEIMDIALTEFLLE